ncbi:hypothetical protein FOY91_06005 [Sphingomonas solaris]|uniref:Uncharacterized protein n=1 Tax=Alterirhizorhabdus solaris TaxID=2529389 RepID=A0A558R8V8_9SPHN|nr:hypothetical protein FOY91_06005 [Sphingomonas solaris]
MPRRLDAERTVCSRSYRHHYAICDPACRHRRSQPITALPCLALPCLALPCLALPCLALPCLAMPCHAIASPIWGQASGRELRRFLVAFQKVAPGESAPVLWRGTTECRTRHD